MGKRATLILSFDLLLIWIFTQHLYISTKGKGADQIFRFTNRSAKYFWTKTQRKLQYLYLKQLGKEKMAQLMNKNKKAKDNNKRNHSIHFRENSSLGE